MAYPWSDQLNVVLKCYKGWKPEETIPISELRSRLAKEFEKNEDCAFSLMSTPWNTIPYGRLLSYLIKTVQYDSAVRDVITTGHLAKVISRASRLRKSADDMVLGLPNRLFDEQSQRERTRYFESTTTLPISGSLLHNSIVQEVRETEKGVLAKFGLV